MSIDLDVLFEEASITPSRPLDLARIEAGIVRRRNVRRLRTSVAAVLAVALVGDLLGTLPTSDQPRPWVDEIPVDEAPEGGRGVEEDVEQPAEGGQLPPPRTEVLGAPATADRAPTSGSGGSREAPPRFLAPEPAPLGEEAQPGWAWDFDADVTGWEAVDGYEFRHEGDGPPFVHHRTGWDDSGAFRGVRIRRFGHELGDAGACTTCDTSGSLISPTMRVEAAASLTIEFWYRWDAPVDAVGHEDRLLVQLEAAGTALSEFGPGRLDLMNSSRRLFGEWQWFQASVSTDHPTFPEDAADFRLVFTTTYEAADWDASCGADVAGGPCDLGLVIDEVSVTLD